MIHQLSQSMINKIAAGEVIERPASVVKEMMENSVDAGSTRIDVAVDKGGSERIRIVDNGCGIAQEELHLALSPHATSKLENADDLFRIKTFGFRGEALASIAEISQLLLRSRPESSREGAEIRSEGGTFSEIVPCGMPQGTVLEVAHLFFNTPVRRGYMRSMTTEFGHILESFIRIALPQPKIHFTLQHNGKLVYELPAESSPLERIRKLFGPEIADHLLFVESHRGPITVSGYVGLPKVSRSNNRMQYFFLNNRYIRDRALQHALSEAYRGLLTTGRFPIAFLQIEMSPEMFDVNVHPTKMEVRFLDSNKIYSHFLGTIREHFLRSDLTSQLSVNDFPGSYLKGVPNRGEPNKREEENDPRTSMDATARENRRQDIVDWAKGLDRKRPETPGSGSRTPDSSGAVFSGSEFPGSGWAWENETGPVQQGTSYTKDGGSAVLEWSQQAGQRREPLRLHERAVVPTSTKNGNLPKPLQSGFSRSPDCCDSLHSSLSASYDQSNGLNESDSDCRNDVETRHQKVMQVHNRYLIRETESGIAIIDQHALHERLLYERLKQRYNSGQPDMQRLLVPIPIDLAPVESACVLENQPLLQQLGLMVEPFGGDTVIITGYPAILEGTDLQEVLLNIIDQLLDSGKKTERAELIEELLHSMSCKAAIKAGEQLRADAIGELLALAEQEVNAHHCPHGRPSVLKLSCEELDKLFKRT
ncbi:MAG: DNA mismatch repair endonuclease MutL [Thermoguttaceae bacterium]